MIQAIFAGCGGLGIFLLGMSLMTDGLRALAGQRLRSLIAGFTHTPASGALTGAVTTALIQSSSATTVTVVGFVGAGLMTFEQALGVIFGANIGTTLTGWLVAVVGFKIGLGTAVLPLVLLGALLRLFGRRGTASAGQALAGFGLIFVGVSMLQQGMGGLEGVLTPQVMPSDTWGGRGLTVLIGFATTLVTQSSSAGVATAITAVHTGTISLHQAAALVIGMDVGTSVTAFVASIGASTSARRTGAAHVIYNAMTGTMAFLLMGGFFSLLGFLTESASSDPELALVAFHTTLNVVGVAVVLPFTSAFARLITRLVPGDGNLPLRRIDPGLLAEPAAALQALASTARELASRCFDVFSALLDGSDQRTLNAEIKALKAYVDEAELFAGEVAGAAQSPQDTAVTRTAMHALDHIDRLLARCSSADGGLDFGEAIPGKQEVRSTAGQAAALLRDAEAALPVEAAEAAWRALQERSAEWRVSALETAAAGLVPAERALARIDIHRWLRRSVYHVWRISHHLESMRVSLLPGAVAPAPAPGREAEAPD